MAKKKKEKASKVETTTTNDTANDTVETANNTVETANEQAEGLTIDDLKGLAQIINLASTRGAFRGNELATIGAVYNKLAGFLASVAQKTEQVPETETSQTETPQTETPQTETPE